MGEGTVITQAVPTTTNKKLRVARKELYGTTCSRERPLQISRDPYKSAERDPYKSSHAKVLSVSKSTPLI